MNLEGISKRKKLNNCNGSLVIRHWLERVSIVIAGRFGSPRFEICSDCSWSVRLLKFRQLINSWSSQWAPITTEIIQWMAKKKLNGIDSQWDQKSKWICHSLNLHSAFTQHSLKIHSFQQSRTMPILQQCSTMLTFKFEFKFKFRFKKKKSSLRRTCLTLLRRWPVDGQWLLDQRLFDQRSPGSEFEREFGRGIWKWSWKSRKNTLRFLCFRSTLLRQCHYCSMKGVQHSWQCQLDS